MTRHLFLSPHLDDVVLSCGARVANASDRGVRVEILTVFAGDEPADPASPLVDTIYSLWSLAAGTVMTTRRTEDLEAARILGAAATHWEEREAIHRRHPRTGAPLYPTIGRLFGPVDDAEEGRIEELAGRLATLDHADLVVAPLGVGGHVDHRILRAAAERAFAADLAYYDEFPYVVWKRLALRRAIGWGRRFTAEVEAPDAARQERKRAAILAYRSQIRGLFRDEAGLDRLLRRHQRRAGGERLWRLRTAGSTASPAAR